MINQSQAKACYASPWRPKMGHFNVFGLKKAQKQPPGSRITARHLGRLGARSTFLVRLEKPPRKMGASEARKIFPIDNHFCSQYYCSSADVHTQVGLLDYLPSKVCTGFTTRLGTVSFRFEYHVSRRRTRWVSLLGLKRVCEEPSSVGLNKLRMISTPVSARWTLHSGFHRLGK